jgi:hypothetical protein
MNKLFAFPLLATCLVGCVSPMEDQAMYEDAMERAKRYVEERGGDGDRANLSSSMADLNGDHLDDVFVYISDEPTVCTGRGCTMLVFENRGNHLKLVSDIRNVHVRLGTEPGESDWSTLIVASKDVLGKDRVGGEPATVYELAFNTESKRGYPSDATEGKLQTW